MHFAGLVRTRLPHIALGLLAVISLALLGCGVETVVTATIAPTPTATVIQDRQDAAVVPTPTVSPGSPPSTPRPQAQTSRSTLLPTPTPALTSPPPLPPTPTTAPLPSELTSGVDALIHCAGETVEYWLEQGPPILTADLAACLNAYLAEEG